MPAEARTDRPQAQKPSQSEIAAGSNVKRSKPSVKFAHVKDIEPYQVVFEPLQRDRDPP